MEYTTLGSSGVHVSNLCLGTWRFNQWAADGTVETDRESAHELLDAFDEAGGNFIDTANDYGDGKAEEWIGEWLDDRDREDYVVASKVFWTQNSRFSENLSRKNVRAEIEGTLDRLDTDYVDIYYLHRFDDATPLERTLRTLDDLVSEGKVHHVGASAMDPWKLVKGLWQADVNGFERFAVTQPRFNAADHPREYLDVCADQDLAVCPYSPLQAGILTGKYAGSEAPEGSRAALNDWEMGLSPRQQRVVAAVEAVAAETGATMAQVALRWLVDQSEFTCVPIFGARSVEQMTENLGAVDVSLSPEQFGRITDAYDE